MNKGIFISFEGPDGAGKTSVLQGLLPKLAECGMDLVTTRSQAALPLRKRFAQLS